jgi:hypothetical protein
VDVSLLAKVHLWLQTIVRYVLGAWMMPYAVSKLMNMQFQLGPEQYVKALGDIPGSTLTWAFLGYSPWFQTLLGAAEFVPSLLLFFRRTQTLGALLMFPVLLNVVLINFALGLWPGTQRISLTMMALNIYLLLSDAPRFRAIFPMLLREPVILRRRRFRIGANVLSGAAAAAVALYFVFQLRSLMAENNSDFTGYPIINRSGEWSVVTVDFDGESRASSGPDYLYFSFGGKCLSATGSEKRPCHFTSSRAEHSFSLEPLRVSSGGAPFRGSYRRDGERLQLTGSSGNHQVKMILQRTRWGHY